MFPEPALQRGQHCPLSGLTPLHWAVKDRKVFPVRLLLEHGADVNARDNAGETSFQYAEQQEISQLLLEYGAKSV